MCSWQCWIYKVNSVVIVFKAVRWLCCHRSDVCQTLTFSRDMNSSSHLLLSGAKEGFLCHTHTCASMQTWMHTHDNTLSHTRIRTHLHCELSCLLLFSEGDTWSDTRMLGVWNTGSHTYTVAACWRRSVPGWMGILCHREQLCGCFPALLISHDLLHVSFPLLTLLQGPAERARETLRDCNSRTEISVTQIRVGCLFLVC